MVYKHVIGLKTDSSQSNLGGNTDSNHLIPGEEWAFSIRLAQPSSRTACNTHFFLLFPGIGCRLFFVLCPSLYLGPCFYSAGCYPAFSYVFSPALNAGVLRFVRGSLAPRLLFVHCAVWETALPFPYVHSPAFNAGFLRRSFRRLMSSGCIGWQGDGVTPLFINLTHAYVCIFKKRVSARPPGLPPTLYILRILAQR